MGASSTVIFGFSKNNNLTMCRCVCGFCGSQVGYEHVFVCPYCGAEIGFYLYE